MISFDAQSVIQEHNKDFSAGYLRCLDDLKHAIVTAQMELTLLTEFIKYLCNSKVVNFKFELLAEKNTFVETKKMKANWSPELIEEAKIMGVTAEIETRVMLFQQLLDELNSSGVKELKIYQLVVTPTIYVLEDFTTRKSIMIRGIFNY